MNLEGLKSNAISAENVVRQIKKNDKGVGRGNLMNGKLENEKHFSSYTLERIALKKVLEVICRWVE